MSRCSHSVFVDFFTTQKLTTDLKFFVSAPPSKVRNLDWVGLEGDKVLFKSSFSRVSTSV